MRDTYRNLFRHSAAYGAGQLIFRVASIVLLPVYTRYLRPADYAAITILDITTGLLSILVGSGMVAALTRHHFDDESDSYRDRLWWTGLVFVAATATAITLPAWLLRGVLADFVLGPEVGARRLYFALALPQLWTGTVAEIPAAYLRVQKRSVLFVALGVGRLAVNVALNLVLLMKFELGASAILVGNLAASISYAIALLVVAGRSLGALQIDRSLIAPLWQYGRPLIVTSLFAMLMHNGDRYILRLFVDMNAIGIYSLAYVVGQGVNTLFLEPFSAIWSVSIYEIADGPEPEKVFASVFRHFFHALALLMFGVSLTARPALDLLVAADFRVAADLIPIVCLAYVFFSLHEHFPVPVLISKRTDLLQLTFAFAALLNIVADFVLIPPFGITGAAWASVATFATFSLFGLRRYRRLARYRYPLLSCGVVLAAMVLCFLAYRSWSMSSQPALPRQLMVAVLLWASWATILFGRPVAALLRKESTASDQATT